MSKPSASAVFLALLFAASFSSKACFAYGVEGAAGIRSAERIDDRHIRVIVGLALNAANAAKEPSKFQIASPDDKDFQIGRGAESVSVKQEEDAEYPDGWEGPRFKRHVVEVTLPPKFPLKAGHRYWIRINSTWLIAFNPRGCWIEDAGKGPTRDPQYGIRETYILTPNILHLITGPGIDLSQLNQLHNISVSSADDDEFHGGLSPSRIGRRSNLDAYIADGWPWRFVQRHELFLVFDKAFKEGKSYKFDLNHEPKHPVALQKSSHEFLVDSRSLQNLAIKVNQTGYLPTAEKYAYLGMWMGDLNACDFSSCAKEFEVRDAATHAVVLTGQPKLRKKAVYKLENGALTPNPKEVPGPETVYKQDLSYEDVYELDLSALKAIGEYYIAIPGMGRSYSFRVADDVYSKPLALMMNGLFHQRSGIELNQPWSEHYSPAGHRNKTEFSTFKNCVDKDPWNNLPKFATDGVKHDIWGGHHDAGDWNPRSHIEVAEMLFLLYEMNPRAFTDGQFNIPESHNGIPDLLDEAMYALDLWTRLQDDDGGVRNGIESNGDPEPGDIPATDQKREFAFAKDAAGSYRFAAVAGQASILWKGLGKEIESKTLLDKATRAWNWAEKNGGAAEHDQHAYAAVMLWRATGDAAYEAAFKEHSVFTKNANAQLDEYQKYNQEYASYYYAHEAKADAALKNSIIRSFESSFKEWAQAAETTAYRYMRHPRSPNTWGTGGLPKWSMRPAMTMMLSSDAAIKAQCKRWLLFSDDFSLGCDPMNLVFTAGLGQRSITGTWHLLMVNSPAGVIPGLQSEGPGGDFIAGEMPGKGGMGKWPGMSMYPPGPWPDLYRYAESAAPGMNEGVTVNMAATAFAYGLFAPAREPHQ